MLTISRHDHDGHTTYEVSNAEDVERFSVELLNDAADGGVLDFDRATNVITIRAANATLRYEVTGMDDWAPDVVCARRLP